LVGDWDLSGAAQRAQGVILRLGQWVDTTGPGLHFHLPFPIETALFPKVTQINQLSLTRAAPDVSGAATRC